MTSCTYCTKDITESEAYECFRCHCSSHLDCMDKKKPSNFKGDHLFTYECRGCSYEGADTLTRMNLNWVQVIHLILYHLTVMRRGRMGYFRWKDEICALIEEHWTCLLRDRVKTTTWLSTVAGSLSVHSHKHFKSGQELFNETGWWALRDVTPPYANTEMYSRTPSRQSTFCPKPTLLHSNREEYGRGKRQRKEKEPPITDVKKFKKDKMLKRNKDTKISESNAEQKDFERHEFIDGSHDFNSFTCEIKEEEDVGNTSHFTEPLPKLIGDFSEIDERVEMKQSIDNVSDSKKKLNKKENKLIMLSVAEELKLLSKWNTMLLLLKQDISVRRLRRKLLLRKYKREKGLPVFNLDDLFHDTIVKTAPEEIKPLLNNRYIKNDEGVARNIDSIERSYHHPALRGVNVVLDRFLNMQWFNKSKQVTEISCVFSRLVGNPDDISDTQCIVSPYTSRLLKPYIRRDFAVEPKKLKIHRRLQEVCGTAAMFKRYPVDYCYIQPKHIPAVNNLCSEFFWPGIDLTECLQYPEFSCVVLYRKLLIGCAFMVPDVKFNEAYISFILVHPDWQRAGIATQMMYHLVQTCMGKDITLHVSPNNPSMVLYQKFAFKTEELILNFYDQYFPKDTPGSRHAFFLRLQR